MDRDQLGKIMIPSKRLISGMPINKVKSSQTSSIFACCDDRGRIFLADSTAEPTTDQESIQFYKRMYFKDFPRNHVEVDLDIRTAFNNAKGKETRSEEPAQILLPIAKIEAHHGLISDFEWVSNETQLMTAGAGCCKIIDVETHQPVRELRGEGLKQESQF